MCNHFPEEIINISDILNQNKLIKVNDFIYLTNFQMATLKKYKIPYESSHSLSEIIFYIEDILQEDSNDYFDLEQVSLQLAENDYYQNYKSKFVKYWKCAIIFSLIELLCLYLDTLLE